MIKKLLTEVPSKKIMAGVFSPLLVATPLLAQVADTNAPTVMKPTVVTGSYIPTAETVGPAPLTVVGAAQIERSGQQDILSTLQKFDPSFSGSANLGQVANNFTILAGELPAGEANVAIRNLPTLVLLDGRRLANSAFSVGQAVDLNTIPLSIIDRVEVLKDGASALYGSDAIGGVINVITKKNWSGVEIAGRVGFPTRPDSSGILERRASVTAGATGDNYSFFAGAQYYYMDPLLTKDRQIASASIPELLDKGILPPAYFSPSYPGRVQDANGSYILAGSPFAAGSAGYNQRLVTPPVYAGQTFTTVDAYNAYAIAHGYVDPTGHGLGPYIPLGSTLGGSQLDALGVGNYPLLNTTDFGTYSILKQDRRNFFANVSRDLFEKNLQFFGSFLYADTLSEAKLAPSPVPSLALSGIAVPGSNPYNPFGIDLGSQGGAGTPRVRSRFTDSGNRTFDADGNTYRFVGGLKGEITPKYDWESAYTFNRSDEDYLTHNAINGAGLNQSLAGTLTDANGNPLPGYNIFGLQGFNATNAPATLQTITTTLFQKGISDLWSVDGHVHGQPIDLPAGPLDFVVGGEYIFESLSLSVDGLTQLGLVPGLNQAFAFSGGHRDRAAGFAEVRIPVFSPSMDVPALYDLEVTAAGRYERIWPGGDSAVPKVAVRWQPIDNQLTFRGGYSEGFIAPSIYNLFGPDFVSNPVLALPGGAGQVQTQTRSNPNLPPSDSKNWNVGFVFSPKPIKGLTLSVDYYNVQQHGVVIADPVSASQSLNAFGSGSPYAPGFVFADGTRLTTTAANQVTVDNWGNLLLTNSATAALRTDGLDLSANYELPTPPRYGKFTLMANANLTLNYEVQSAPNNPYYHYEGQWTANFGTAQGLIPDYRINCGLTWDYEGFMYTVLAHYIPGVEDLGFLHPQIGDTSQEFTLNGQAWHVPSYYTVDMQVAYRFNEKFGRFLNGLRLAVGCNNITDVNPPLIASAIEDNTDKSTYDLLGRFVYFEISKRF